MPTQKLLSTVGMIEGMIDEAKGISAYQASNNVFDTSHQKIDQSCPLITLSHHGHT